MAIFHSILGSRSYSYLIIRNGIYYFSIRRDKSVIRKSLYTSNFNEAKEIVKNILRNPLSHSCSAFVLKSLVKEQVLNFAKLPPRGDKVVKGAPAHSKTADCQTTPCGKGLLTYPEALDLWSSDKASNLHIKKNGDKVLAKTKNEKLSYLHHVFKHLWMGKPISHISSSDIDYALHIFGRSAKKNSLPWANMSVEKQIAAAISGEVPVECRFNRSLKRVKTALNCFFEHYWRLNVLPKNPMSDIRFLCDGVKYRKRGAFTSIQLKKLTDYCQESGATELTVAIALQLFAGVRNKEIELISKKDLNKFRGVYYLHIKGTKTANAERFIPLHPRLIELGVMDYFINGKRALSSPKITYEFSKLMDQLGLPRVDEQGNTLSFYSLRHNFATALAKSGASDIHIEWLMGHAHSGVKSRYIKNGKEQIPVLDKVVSKIHI